MRTEYRDGIMFCIVAERAFDLLREGAQIVGRTEGGVSWRKGNSLLSMELNGAGDGWTYSVCPNFFLLTEQSAELN